MLKLKNSDLKINFIPYSADDARQLVQNRIGSRQKAEKELSFKYKYSLEDGLKALIIWREKKGI
jgi:UDP-glucose 4-epimerase